ncbi:serine/threonine-protein kinase [Chondromyces apiculatus]|uniref:Serine/threonine protein kinase n=1 Tax=Chondromyces apiculatus DSM 436 TaxID=1192034 RepID=A0A017SWI1_9BACT|nr:serine/threonine-protein kinase [Chondromyces apiculatus]EYF00666.1 serine/threonine protein kinase [Chondromyces apiculatus DSM 436]
MEQRAIRPAGPKASTVDPMIGKVVAGRYRLEARVGEGGMGVVYRARHVLIERVVALKLIRPDLRGETHLRAWMLREARAANRVDHAHIIDIHDIGETEEGELYLVMEFLVGTPLSAELARGPTPIARAVDILEQMCAALARAHDLGVVHRDLKSDNILLTQRGGRKDFVKILDFGLAAIARDPRLAPKGAVFGTPEYMSPEQARGEEAGPQSDLYALGVLFFEMLTGQLPFRSNDRDTLLEMQRTHLPPRPRSIRPEAHAQGELICLRLLEKDVRKRYRDAHHLQEELKAMQRSLPTQAAWELEGADAMAMPPPAPPPPQSPGVIEWASRAALFARMVSRAYPSGQTPPEVQTGLTQIWDLAQRANRLEGEVASLTRKLDALERRGRALRAEIGRKVEELAHEESRVMREAAVDAEDVDKVRGELAGAEKQALTARQLADAAARQGTHDPMVYERAGAAGAIAQAKREQLGRYEQKKNMREATARDLRRQIEELRAQLARYAEALEEDLAQGRERVAVRTREGVQFERSFTEISNMLLGQLRNRPECRDLVNELLASSNSVPNGENATAEQRLSGRLGAP